MTTEVTISMDEYNNLREVKFRMDMLRDAYNRKNIDGYSFGNDILEIVFGERKNSDAE